MLGVVHSLVATYGRLAKQKPLKRLRAGVPAVSDHINTKPLNTVEHLVIYFRSRWRPKQREKESKLWIYHSSLKHMPIVTFKESYTFSTKIKTNRCRLSNDLAVISHC